MGFRRRQVITAALTANALRPLPGFEMGPLSFFAGWLTSDLAPHLLAVTTADAVTHATRSRRDPVGLLQAGTSAAALAYMVKQSHDVKVRAEDSLTEALGVDYVEQLDEKPTPADLAVPWRRLVYPFRMRDRRGPVGRGVCYNRGSRSRCPL